MTDEPVLALLAATGTSKRAVPLLGLLGRHATVVSWHRRAEHVPAAVLATTVGALDALAGEPAVPTAVWVRHHDEVDRARASGATVLLTARPELVARGALLVPPVGLEVDRWRPVAPLVRRRWRERLCLPEQHVVQVESGVEPIEGERALQVASVAVVSGPATLLALALATPVVTSGDTARRLGLRPGRDVEVAASAEDALALAHQVADDDARAAALSRRARRCAEHHLDLGRPARQVARALGLSPEPLGAQARLDLRLDELATPESSLLRQRAGDALAALVAHGQGSSS